MNQEPNNTPKPAPLKLQEPTVDPWEPWSDDVLDRQELANRLTNLVATQELPIVVSLHGGWGTGKTFMLKRWQADLKSQGVRAIYLNAWEDDFCDDPLLALLGELSEHFKEGTLKGLADKVKEVALPLLKMNVLSVLHRHTGLTLELEGSERDLLDEYRSQSATKDDLKENLSKLSIAVFEETQRPLVFIIDELDRCRPTFAIELLERIKHIFDIPHMVFVLGLNRDELQKSLTSVYGEIDSDVYLRRFFDFEFRLPETSSWPFAAQLLSKFRLDQALGMQPGRDYDGGYLNIVPTLWSALRLRLRDIDYGVRLLALMVSSVSDETHTHPHLLSILIALKFKNPKLYQSLISGDVQAKEVLDYIDEQTVSVPATINHGNLLDRIEGLLYCCDDSYVTSDGRGGKALEELDNLSTDDDVPASLTSSLSERAQRIDSHRRKVIAQSIREGRFLPLDGQTFRNLARLIDVCQGTLK